MKHEFRLADIGEGLEEAEIISWLVQVGDTVSRDQPMVEVMTDKSNAELPAPAAGTVVSLGGAVGDILTVGELIAVIDGVGGVDGLDGVDSATADAAVPSAEVPLASDLDGMSTEPEPTFDAAIDRDPVLVPDAPAAPRPKASPSTRREAAARGIDLGTVAGSGPGGRILLTDLDQPVTATPPPAAASPPAAAAPVSEAPPLAQAAAPPVARAEPAPAASDLGSGTTPLRGIRRVVAQNMARSWFDIPHIHAFEHIDAQPLLDVRARLKESVRPGYTASTPVTFFVAAVASAMRAFPQANASINMAEETITTHPTVNIGIAVASPQGLVVPVLHDAGALHFEEIAEQLGVLVRAARDGTLTRSQQTGGTVTITNFGSLGGEQAAPLIRPPESLILGFGSIADRPFVIDGDVVARKTMHLVAGADHRLLDGDVTTSILRHVADVLTDPLQVVLN